MFWKRRKRQQRGKGTPSSRNDDDHSSLQVVIEGRPKCEKKKKTNSIQQQCMTKTPLAYCMRPARSVFSSGCGISSRRGRPNTKIVANNNNNPDEHFVLHHRDGCPVEFPTKYDPKIQLDTYTFVLSLNDISLNAIGMEKLLQASKPPKTTNPIDDCHGDKVARAIVYGGEPNSAEEHLRYIFLGYLCDTWYSSRITTTTTSISKDRREDKNTLEDDDTIICKSGSSSTSVSNNNGKEKQEHRRQEEEEDSYIYDEDEDDEDDQRGAYLRGTNWGVLHFMALKVLVSSLEQVLATSPSDQPLDPIDFSKDPFWPSIVDTLRSNIRNVELLQSHKITEISLKCLRLLCSFRPTVVQKVLQHTFMPYILYLHDYYGSVEKKNRKIQYEASLLLKQMMYNSCGEQEEQEYQEGKSVTATTYSPPREEYHTDEPDSTTTSSTLDEDRTTTTTTTTTACSSPSSSKEEDTPQIEPRAPEGGEAQVGSTTSSTVAAEEMLELTGTYQTTEDAVDTLSCDPQKVQDDPADDDDDTTASSSAMDDQENHSMTPSTNVKEDVEDDPRIEPKVPAEEVVDKVSPTVICKQPSALQTNTSDDHSTTDDSNDTYPNGGGGRQSPQYQQTDGSASLSCSTTTVDEDHTTTSSTCSSGRKDKEENVHQIELEIQDEKDDQPSSTSSTYSESLETSSHHITTENGADTGLPKKDQVPPRHQQADGPASTTNMVDANCTSTTIHSTSSIEEEDAPQIESKSPNKEKAKAAAAPSSCGESLETSSSNTMAQDDNIRPRKEQ